MSKAKIFDLLNLLVVTSGKPQDLKRLEIYTENLAEFPPQKVESAIRWCMQNLKFFPSLSEIRHQIKPPKTIDDEASDMTGEIIDTVSRLGSWNEKSAKLKLGESAWRAVTLYGGWKNLCLVGLDQLPIVRAQLRRLCATRVIESRRQLYYGTKSKIEEQKKNEV